VHSKERCVASVAAVITRRILSYLKHCEDRLSQVSCCRYYEVNTCTTYSMLGSLETYKHTTRSEFVPSLLLLICDNAWGQAWFSCAKNLSRSPWRDSVNDKEVLCTQPQDIPGLTPCNYEEADTRILLDPCPRCSEAVLHV